MRPYAAWQFIEFYLNIVPILHESKQLFIMVAHKMAMVTLRFQVVITINLAIKLWKLRQMIRILFDLTFFIIDIWLFRIWWVVLLLLVVVITIILQWRRAILFVMMIDELLLLYLRFYLKILFADIET